jgi:hypothetical protein
MEHDPHNAQNWCPDPFGLHEARWFSNGIPTALVRDAGVEAQDPPPESVFDRRYELPSIELHDPEPAPAHHRFRHRRSSRAAAR